MAALNVQEYYSCDTCKYAEDSYGRNCGKGMLTPLLLIMAGKRHCPDYKFDREKMDYEQG